MGSAPLSWTIPTRSSTHALSKVGAQSEFSPPILYEFLSKACRCTAKNDNLDNPDVPRTYELAERLILALDAQELWDDFGMVKDIAVRVSTGILAGIGHQTHTRMSIIAFHE